MFSRAYTNEDIRWIQELVSSKEKHEVGEEKPKNQINLNPIRRLFDGDRSIPQKHIEPYVAKGQVVADLGCGPGYYTLALAECVDPEGRVYAVDLNENHIGVLEKKADNRFRSRARARSDFFGYVYFRGSFSS